MSNLLCRNNSEKRHNSLLAGHCNKEHDDHQLLREKGWVFSPADIAKIKNFHIILDWPNCSKIKEASWQVLFGFLGDTVQTSGDHVWVSASPFWVPWRGDLNLVLRI